MSRKSSRASRRPEWINIVLDRLCWPWQDHWKSREIERLIPQNEMSGTWGRIIPGTSTCWSLTLQKAGLLERTRCRSWCPWSGNTSLKQRRSTVSLDVSERASPTDQEKWSFHFINWRNMKKYDDGYHTTDSSLEKQFKSQAYAST